MALGLFHFQLLHNILEQIHFIYEETDLCDMVLQTISSALNSEGGTIFRLQPDGKLVPIAAFGVSLDRLKSLRFEAGIGVVGWVVKHAQPIKVDAPGHDQRFTGSVDVITGFKTRNIVAAPILSKGHTVGVIEFLNRKDGAFSIPEMELVSMLGREVGIAFENAHLFRELNRTRALLDAMTDSFAAGILVVDLQGQFLRINPSALRILGITDSEAKFLGHPYGDMFPAESPFALALKIGIQTQEIKTRQELSLELNGSKHIIGYSTVPVKDKAGERLGTSIMFQDITAYTTKR